MKPGTTLGIAIAHATCMPGQTRTLEEIAAYCDCTVNCISKIEQKAIRKLRRRLCRRDPLALALAQEALFR